MLLLSILLFKKQFHRHYLTRFLQWSYEIRITYISVLFLPCLEEEGEKKTESKEGSEFREMEREWGWEAGVGGLGERLPYLQVL